MKEKSTKKLVIHIIQIILGALFLIGFIVCIVLQLIAPELEVSLWMKQYVWDVSKTGEDFQKQLPTIIHSLIFIVLIFAISKILRTIFKTKIIKSGKTKTVVTLLDGFVKYGCAIAIFVFILIAFGVSAEAIFGAAGVLTLVIGLGAQTLIADIIAGVFLVFENEFSVDEIITVDGFRGKVIEIGIRTTKLLDAAGNIKIINHSAITNVVNLSRELSLAVVDCDFPYDVPIEYIESLFEKHFEGIKERIPDIVEGPFYKGVCMYKDSNVTIKIVARCHEDNRFQVERDLMREYRQILTDAGIDISYPQVVISTKKENDIKLTKKDKKVASEFQAEQRELSEGLDDQEK